MSTFDEAPPPAAAPHCTHCGSTDMEPGFLDDSGEGSRGYLRWIVGPLELGALGRAKRMGKQRFAVMTFRCRACAHLELFVPR